MLEVNKKFYDGFFSQFQTSFAFAKARHMPAIKFSYVDWWDAKDEEGNVPFSTKVYHDTYDHECFIDVSTVVKDKLKEIEEILGETIKLNYINKCYVCTVNVKLADAIENHTAKIINSGFDCTYPLLVKVEVMLHLRDSEFLHQEDYQNYQTITIEKMDFRDRARLEINRFYNEFNNRDKFYADLNKNLNKA